MYCSKCGKNSPYSSNFCNYCGAEFLDKKMTKRSYENYYKPKKYIDWQTPVFLISCVVILVFLFLFIIPSIKSFVDNRFVPATHVYANVERSYKGKCEEANVEVLRRGKGNKKDSYYRVSGLVIGVVEGDNKYYFEINITREEDGGFTDTVLVEYNDIRHDIKVDDIVVFWGRDYCSGDTREAAGDEDPRIIAEYASKVNKMALGL